MSVNGFRKRSIMMYLRPIAYVKPDQIYACAKWLVALGKFKSVSRAQMWLVHLDHHHTWEFKTVLADYYEHLERSLGYPKKRDVNTYVAAKSRKRKKELYGSEPHMYAF